VVDIFEEVDEHLRSDRLGVIARRWLPWIIGVLLLALVVALGWWGVSALQQKTIDSASEAYSNGLDTLTKGDPDQAYAKFGEAASKGAAAYKALALMQQAGIRMQQNRVNEAVALFDQAAAATSDPILSDAARLKSAFALLDTAPYAELEARLKPLADANRPFHALAREAMGVALLRVGRSKEALSDFTALTLMTDAPQDVRQRAGAAIVLIKSGDAGQVPQIVQAAEALPPNPPADSSAPASAQPPAPEGAAQ